MNGPRLIAYIRVSKVGERAGDAFQAPGQQRDAIGHAAALAGGTIIEEIVDLNESGGTMNRPGLKRAMKMLREGAADGIVVARLDRFGRTLEVPIVIEQMEADGHRFISASDSFDTSTPMGRFALGLMALVARLERERHIETWAVSTRNAIERGVAIRIPYGYERGQGGRLAPVEPAASVVRDIFRQRAAGVGIADIAHKLNADRIPPANSAVWTRQSVRALLRIRTYLGEAKYADNLNTTAHEPIISAELFAAAQTERTLPNRPLGASLLTGIIRCAGCGYMMGASSAQGVRRYGCGRHHGGGRCPSPTTVSAHLVHDYVTALFLERYGSAGAHGGGQGREVAAAEAAVDRARGEFEWWRDDPEVRSQIGTADYLAGLTSRRSALDDAQAAHARAVRASGASGLQIDAAAWEDLTVPEQRSLIAAGVDAVLLSRPRSTHSPVSSRCDVLFVGDQPRLEVSRQGRPGVLRTVSRDP